MARIVAIESLARAAEGDHRHLRDEHEQRDDGRDRARAPQPRALDLEPRLADRAPMRTPNSFVPLGWAAQRFS